MDNNYIMFSKFANFRIFFTKVILLTLPQNELP